MHHVVVISTMLVLNIILCVGILVALERVTHISTTIVQGHVLIKIQQIVAVTKEFYAVTILLLS